MEGQEACSSGGFLPLHRLSSAYHGNMSTEHSSAASPARGRVALFGLLAGIAGATMAALIAVLRCARDLIALFGSNVAFEGMHSSHASSSQPARLGSLTGEASYSVFTSTAPDPLALVFLTAGHLLLLCAVLIPAAMVIASCTAARRGRLGTTTFPRLIIRSGLVIFVLGGAGAALLAVFAGAVNAPGSSDIGAVGPVSASGIWGVSPAPFIIGTVAIACGLITRAVQNRGDHSLLER